MDDVSRIALSATRSRLFIDCIDLQDEATYTCVAENAFSRVYSHSKLNLIKPTVVQANSDNDFLSGSLDEALELAAPAGTSSQAAAVKQMEMSEKVLSAVPQCLSQRGTLQTGKCFDFFPD